jgi:hypothetical protein
MPVIPDTISDLSGMPLSPKIAGWPYMPHDFGNFAVVKSDRWNY